MRVKVSACSDKMPSCCSLQVTEDLGQASHTNPNLDTDNDSQEGEIAQVSYGNAPRLDDVHEGHREQRIVMVISILQLCAMLCAKCQNNTDNTDFIAASYIINLTKCIIIFTH